MSGGSDRPRPGPASIRAGFGIVSVEVKGFRSARDVSFSLGRLCALVGEARAGKSNLLAAIRAALDPEAAPLAATDAADGGDGRVLIRLGFADGGETTLAGAPGRSAVSGRDGSPPLLFLPAEARAGPVLGGGTPTGEDAGRALKVFRHTLARDASTPAAKAGAVVEAVESCCSLGLEGLVLLIEEPELYLRPQAQRYLYRLLRTFALGGNQVVYSTHSPAFLNVARLDELVFVQRLLQGTRALQPRRVTADDDFRVMTEFDAARSELFLAHAVLLVEGLTEKLVLPFVFAALGHDVDREAISIVECGGKPNIPLFARICQATGIPFVVVHDSDRRASGKLVAAERSLNALIAEIAGEDRIVVLDPDFEAVAGLTGGSRKPERAWRDFASRPAARMPRQLADAAELAISLARS